MDIEVRLATARDRQALDRFYSREGLNFQALSIRSPHFSTGSSKETMFIIAVSDEAIIAALKLDVVVDESIGKIGYIQHFEVEDEYEKSDLGEKMMNHLFDIGKKKGLRALDVFVSEDRSEMRSLYNILNFLELGKTIHLRKHFKERPFYR
ncbi:MAG: GNAT family N-acetyltransferase [Candidatus Lokiarchaeota archaeon]|nr:GNAT family N-acetyltransferase [Candidatus Lokiarchaeota archaeon]